VSRMLDAGVPMGNCQLLPIEIVSENTGLLPTSATAKYWQF
jgi:hypothetical protein